MIAVIVSFVLLICFSIGCIVCCVKIRKNKNQDRGSNIGQTVRDDDESTKQKIVKNFDFEYEKSRLIGDLFARVKREAFSHDRRKSVVVKNG